ncbi:MAG: HNH endonuclease [Cyanobacteriota bacterium]
MQDFCWHCLRSKSFLQNLRPSLSLQVHHVIAVQDGGGDQSSNLMLLCSECHAEVHRRRESFQRYHSGLDFSE